MVQRTARSQIARLSSGRTFSSSVGMVRELDSQSEAARDTLGLQEAAFALPICWLPCCRLGMAP